MKKNIIAILVIALLVSVMGATLSGCQKSKDKEAPASITNATTIERVQIYAEGDVTVPSDYDKSCTIENANGSYNAKLSNTATGKEEVWPLKPEIWSGFTAAKANCAVVNDSGKKYLAIYGDNAETFIEVFPYK